jgi:hypothetical protein
MEKDKYELKDLIKFEGNLRLAVTNIIIANELNNINQTLKKIKKTDFEKKIVEIEE